MFNNMTGDNLPPNRALSIEIAVTNGLHRISVRNLYQPKFFAQQVTIINLHQGYELLTSLKPM
jgi:hypothetical protein